MTAPLKPQSVGDLASHFGGRVVGDETLLINRIANLESAGENEISYVDDEKFFEAGKASRAACLIAPREFVALMNGEGPALIDVAKPKLAFSLIASLLHPQRCREPVIHPTAVISENVDIDLTVYIGPHV